MRSRGPNLSPNSGRFTGQFAALRHGTCRYSAGMNFGSALAVKLLATFALFVYTTLPAAAQPVDVGAGLEQQVRDLALASTRGGAAGTPRIEIVVGLLDPRLRLAPCTHVEPYLPEGVRLWGRSRIGLRCTAGSIKWNVYLPITVKVFGNALVASSGMPAGSVLTAADLTPAEVDLAEETSPPIATAELALGRTLARALKPGQSLRAAHLKARQWFAAGETVTVLAQGAGFSVSGEAQALNNGIEGQPVRVRAESGRVLTGQPVGERRVALEM